MEFDHLLQPAHPVGKGGTVDVELLRRLYGVEPAGDVLVEGLRQLQLRVGLVKFQQPEQRGAAQLLHRVGPPGVAQRRFVEVVGVFVAPQAGIPLLAQTQRLSGLYAVDAALIEIPEIAADPAFEKVLPEEIGKAPLKVPVLLPAEIVEAKQAVIPVDHDARRESALQLRGQILHGLPVVEVAQRAETEHLIVLPLLPAQGHQHTPRHQTVHGAALQQLPPHVVGLPASAPVAPDTAAGVERLHQLFDQIPQPLGQPVRGVGDQDTAAVHPVAVDIAVKDPGQRAAASRIEAQLLPLEGPGKLRVVLKKALHLFGAQLFAAVNIPEAPAYALEAVALVHKGHVQRQIPGGAVHHRGNIAPRSGAHQLAPPAVEAHKGTHHGIAAPGGVAAQKVPPRLHRLLLPCPQNEPPLLSAAHAEDAPLLQPKILHGHGPRPTPPAKGAAGFLQQIVHRGQSQFHILASILHSVAYTG